MKYKDLTGRQFGNIIVENYAESDKHGKAYWNCYCLCNPSRIYKIRGASLLSGNTLSCGCLKQSHGEYYIEKLLKENNISYQKEYSFNDLKDIYLLRFDFAIFQNNQLQYLIEYDGEQHYQENRIFNDSLQQRQYRDNLKNEYCIKNNIPLIRIPHYCIKQLTILELIPKTSNYVFKSENFTFNNNQKTTILIKKTKRRTKTMAMSEKTQTVLNYLKGIDGANVTSADIAEALGMEKKSVDGIVTSGLQRKGLAERIPAEIELEDGSHKAVKFIKLTAEGAAFVPGVTDAEPVEA